jgi:transposase InsO family protein
MPTSGQWTNSLKTYLHTQFAMLARCHHALVCYSTDLKTMKVKSIRGYRYFQVFVDDNSSKGWVYFLRTKSDAALVYGVMRFVNEVCKPAGIQRCLRLDNADEFFSDAMVKFCARNGIRLVPTPAYRQAFNGVAEVFIKILMNIVRPMLATALLHAYLWCLCVEYACRIRNVCLRYPAWTSPNQRFDGTTADINTFHIWGCLVIAHINRTREDPDLSERG